MYNQPTKQQYVYDILREEIISNTLEPGTRLTFRALAQRMGVSEIPVREAVKQLEAEGLIRITPHTGIRVTELSTDEIREIAEIREALEPLAARLAAVRMNDDALESLDDILDKMATAVEEGDGERYGELNRVFHRTMYRASDNTRLYNLIVSLWDNVDRYRAVFRVVPGHMERSLREHRLIVDALRARDAEGVYHAMALHRRNVATGLRRLVEEFSDDGHVVEDK